MTDLFPLVSFYPGRDAPQGTDDAHNTHALDSLSVWIGGFSFPLCKMGVVNEPVSELLCGLRQS